MTFLYTLAGLVGGYTAIGWLAGTQAWGLKVLEVLFQVLVQAPFELVGELLGAILSD